MTTKRTALVTGANKGIGRETARQLARRDYTVWLGCRDEGRGRKTEEELRAEGLDVHFVQLDIDDSASVRAALATVEQSTPQLNVLVNNVGVETRSGARPSEEDLDAIRTMFDTNVFGTVRVTQTFLPLVRRADSGRIVMMSSAMGSITLTGDMKFPTFGLDSMGYSASKAALNMFVVKLAKELMGEGIKVNAACPGAVQTDMGGPVASRTVEQGSAIAVSLATLGWMGPTGGFFHDGEEPGIAHYAW